MIGEEKQNNMKRFAGEAAVAMDKLVAYERLKNRVMTYEQATLDDDMTKHYDYKVNIGGMDYTMEVKNKFAMVAELKGDCGLDGWTISSTADYLLNRFHDGAMLIVRMDDFRRFALANCTDDVKETSLYYTKEGQCTTRHRDDNDYMDVTCYFSRERVMMAMSHVYIAPDVANILN